MILNGFLELKQNKIFLEFMYLFVLQNYKKHIFIFQSTHVILWYVNLLKEKKLFHFQEIKLIKTFTSTLTSSYRLRYSEHVISSNMLNHFLRNIKNLG